MEVVGDYLWFNAKQLLVKLDGVSIMLQRFNIFQVGDVLAQEGVFIPCQAEGVFELGATGENLF